MARMVCGRVTHCNGTHGMRVDDSLQWCACHVYVVCTSPSSLGAPGWAGGDGMECGLLTHCNGTHGMRTRDSLQWNARNVDN